MAEKAHRIAIVGGGFAGLQAARSLRDMPVEITLVDKRNFHLFQPMIVQVAAGILCPSEITTPLRHIFRKQKNVNVVLGEVVDFDTERNKVVLGDGELEYDSLILAAGSNTNYFGHDEWAGIAPSLKTLDGAAEIRQRIFYAFEVAEREPHRDKRLEWLTFVIVGGGIHRHSALGNDCRRR